LARPCHWSADCGGLQKISATVADNRRPNWIVRYVTDDGPSKVPNCGQRGRHTAAARKLRERTRLALVAPHATPGVDHETGLQTPGGGRRPGSLGVRRPWSATSLECDDDNTRQLYRSSGETRSGLALGGRSERPNHRCSRIRRKRSQRTDRWYADVHRVRTRTTRTIKRRLSRPHPAPSNGATCPRAPSTKPRLQAAICRFRRRRHVFPAPRTQPTARRSPAYDQVAIDRETAARTCVDVHYFLCPPECVPGYRNDLSNVASARGLIDWSQQRLADAAGVSLSRVRDFEKAGARLGRMPCRYPRRA
jgi:hypothetical protein